MFPREKLARLNEIARDTGAHARLTALFDEGSFTETDALLAQDVVTGFGTIEGSPCFAYAQANCVLTADTAARVCRLYALARKNGAPVVAVFDSPGARLTDGVEVLNAYGELLRAANELSGVVPQIAVVTGACLGTSALLAAAADFLILSEDGAEFALTGSSSAKEAAESGVCHLLAENADCALDLARRLVAMLPSNNLAVAPMAESADPAPADALRDLEPDVAAAMDSVADLDTLLALSVDCASEAKTALASVAGQTVAMAGVQGALTADGCRKLVRFARFADAFSLPLVTFLNSEGFADSDVRAVTYYAKLANVYAEATCPQAAVVIGDAFGPVFTALAGKSANADVVYAWPNAVISALKPETAASILYNDKITAEHPRAQWAAEYADTEASAFAAAKRGAVDDVIDPADTRSALVSALDLVAGKRENRLPKKHTTL